MDVWRERDPWRNVTQTHSIHVYTRVIAVRTGLLLLYTQERRETALIFETRRVEAKKGEAKRKRESQEL